MPTCSNGSSMLQPIERPPASKAPRLAASMTPGPPPVITANPELRQQAAQPSRRLVHRVRRGEPRRAEHAHRRADLGQGIDPVDELALDPQDAPGLGVGECTMLRRPRGRLAQLRALEELLVGRLPPLRLVRETPSRPADRPRPVPPGPAGMALRRTRTRPPIRRDDRIVRPPSSPSPCSMADHHFSATKRSARTRARPAARGGRPGTDACGLPSSGLESVIDRSVIYKQL